MPFADRVDAGERLAHALEHLRGNDVVVLGLPRGGVPVAWQVARWMRAPFDVVVVRKLGVPQQPELAMGAIGEGGVRVINPVVLRATGVTSEQLTTVELAERAELERRVRQLRGGRPRVNVDGRTAIVIDDGVATGATIRAACQVVRADGAARVVIATPVAPPHVADRLSDDADEVVCLETPSSFGSVGQFYQDFRTVSDEEVAMLLRAGPAAGRHSRDEEVAVAAGDIQLPGHLTVPPGADGVVVFAHGSGSGRASPRNKEVAGALYRAGHGTLLFDLLTRDEEADRHNVFDLPLLAGRLIGATNWLRSTVPDGLPVGYFGASTGAAAALWAAASLGSDIAAVVSRGGRPDLASARLPFVTAPTLLIVGGADTDVLGLNRMAASLLTCEHRTSVVPGASHLFEEPGALAAVAAQASAWFREHFAVPVGVA